MFPPKLLLELKILKSYFSHAFKYDIVYIKKKRITDYDKAPKCFAFDGII